MTNDVFTMPINLREQSGSGMGASAFGSRADIVPPASLDPFLALDECELQEILAAMSSPPDYGTGWENQ